MVMEMSTKETTQPKRVLFVATVLRAHIMEFHTPYLKMFKEMGWHTSVAANNDYNSSSIIKIPYCDQFYDVPFERAPFHPRNINAYRKLKRIIKEGNFDIIHCHTPVGGFLTRLAAKNVRKSGTKVFYTAHGFHFFYGAPFINWLLYYPVEKRLAQYTDALITINDEDYERAKSFKAKNVYYVPGVGIDLNEFSVKALDKEVKRKELGIKKDDFVLLTVAELIPRKNYSVVLKALSHLKKEDKLNDISYVICGIGKSFNALQKLSANLGISDHVFFLGYRNDISEICNVSDAFVFMTKQEGLPVALMEAAASGLAVICSDVRGNRDLIQDGVNGLVAADKPEAVAEAILTIKKDPNLRQRLVASALKDIQKYDLTIVLKIMQEIYGL